MVMVSHKTFHGPLPRGAWGLDFIDGKLLACRKLTRCVGFHCMAQARYLKSSPKFFSICERGSDIADSFQEIPSEATLIPSDSRRSVPCLHVISGRCSGTRDLMLNDSIDTYLG